jgi:hypothetical protein
MKRIVLIALFSLALLATGVKLQPTQHLAAKTHHTAAAAPADDEGSGGGTDPDTVEQGPDGDGNVEG